MSASLRPDVWASRAHNAENYGLCKILKAIYIHLLGLNHSNGAQAVSAKVSKKSNGGHFLLPFVGQCGSGNSPALSLHLFYLPGTLTLRALSIALSSSRAVSTG